MKKARNYKSWYYKRYEMPDRKSYSKSLDVSVYCKATNEDF